ncbi:DUF2637 domain-containing protein [Streptacidiphilus sp. ASG 303]|uniref:DUF2637 domain-containing protein n=1 Tax=Streptacidiphilus sp. ASG 303 TaxID=2896847 RepID=UPI001E35C8A6|nr:DUF2637 domain-containing protein [Streptacidiphilus sp. ASG 303]MCD0485225.1 DUF2637 domain-containing protein [Streptacidiphilus sp. ASG 303]
MSSAGAPRTAHITRGDRAVVIALGGAGCALSYDALQQMAVAIHVRGLLTYLFPLVIDGFIAYGIRALLVLRDAPLRARLYVWTLFGTATAASIWANALHAVRINEEATAVTGLRLGDTVVAALSTIAPLALAGAVHLYILIARGPVKGGDRGSPGQADRPEGTAVTRTHRVGQVSAGQPASALSDRPRLSPDKLTRAAWSPAGDSTPMDSSNPLTGPNGQPLEVADLPGQSGMALPATDRPVGPESATGSRDSLTTVTRRPATPPSVRDRGTRTPGDRRSDPDTEELLKIAREAVRAEDKLTRKVVAQAIRGQRIPLSSDTLTALMVQLRQQRGQSATSARS